MMARATACTIISREMIKPSSPTPSHLRTYNLSEIDERIPHVYMPIILYYPHNEIYSLTPDDKVRVIKKSLSQSLTRYYPFAGIFHTPTSPHVDCNDEGAVFVEAKHDSQMNMLQLTSDEDDAVEQLFVDGMFWKNSPKRATILGVQVNHFACGGMAVAVSMSHKIGDGSTLGSFVSHWASVARYGSTDHKEVLPLNPHFVHHQAITNVSPEIAALEPRGHNIVLRRFVFPNSKLSDLKNKVLALVGGESINNPTRVEVLASLLYKTAVATITRNLTSSSFKPYFLVFPSNIRSKFVPELPKTAVGNFIVSTFFKTQDEIETSLSVLVSKIKKTKIELERVQNMQLAHQWAESMLSSLGNEELENVAKRFFLVSSLCGLGYNKVDFGWGNPAVACMTLRPGNQVGSYLMDTPNGDGIEAWVTLETQHMEVFQKDKDLLSFCQS